MVCFVYFLQDQKTPPLFSSSSAVLRVCFDGVRQFPRTSIVHTYLLGHKDFVSALAAVPGDGVLLLSGGGDGMVGLWDADAGEG